MKVYYTIFKIGAFIVLLSLIGGDAYSRVGASLVLTDYRPNILYLGLKGNSTGLYPSAQFPPIPTFYVGGKYIGVSNGTLFNCTDEDDNGPVPTLDAVVDIISTANNGVLGRVNVNGVVSGSLLVHGQTSTPTAQTSITGGLLAVTPGVIASGTYSGTWLKGANGASDTMMLTVNGSGSTEDGTCSYSGAIDVTREPCPVDDILPITDNPTAPERELENYYISKIGQPSPPAPQSAIDRLSAPMKLALQNFRAAYPSLVVTSAHRNIAYQNHIKSVWDTYKKLQNTLPGQCEEEKVEAEHELKDIHRLTFAPASDSRHAGDGDQNGEAIDVAGMTASGPPQILAAANQAGLYRRVLRDKVHFERCPPSPTPCPIQRPYEQPPTKLRPMLTELPISVRASEHVIGGQFVYRYQIVNRTTRPILTFKIGLDSNVGPELSLNPVGWDEDTVLASTAPPGWTPESITVEENPKNYLEWRATDTSKALFPYESLAGFSIVVAQRDISYLNSHWTVELDTGEIDSRVLQRSMSKAAEFDHDDKADLAVFRPTNNKWYLQRRQAGYTFEEFGVAGDLLAPADYDGDGRTEIGVFRPSTGTWYWFNPVTRVLTQVQWGAPGDLPVPADYDGDGKADLVVFRPSNSTWYMRLTSSDGTYATTFSVLRFGTSGDKPLVGDFDGDGKADLAVFRPSTNTWYLRQPGGGYTSRVWGIQGDIPVAADYDGDGKTDIATFRPSTGNWFIVKTLSGFVEIRTWGQSGDIPVAADYDGDGKTDVAVFRPANATWYIVQSTAGFLTLPFGQDGDIPTPSAFIY